MQQRKPSQPPRAAAPGARQTCPNCHALVQDGDIICVACGTNLLTGQKVVPGGKPVSAMPGRLLWLALGVVAALLVLGILAYVVYSLTRDPVKQAVQLGMAGNYLEASSILTTYVEKHPDNAQVQFELGKMRWRLTQFPSAASAFEKASELDRTNLDAAMLAVASLAAAGGPTTRDQRTAILKRVVQQFPKNARALYLLGLELGAANDVAGEIDALKKVADLKPGDADVQESLGIALALQGNHADAQRALTQAAQPGGANGDLLAAMGFVKTLAGETAGAQEQLAGAVAIQTSVRNEALTRLGLLLSAQGRFQEADTYLSEAAANKDNATAQFFHAVCLQDKGLIPEALHEFEAVAQRSVPLSGEAFVRAAALNLVQGNAQPAREALDKAEAAGVKTAAFYTVRGRVQAANNEDDRARESFRKAQEVDPGYGAAHLENGLLYVKQQAFNEGIQELQRYLDLVGPNQEGARVTEVQMLVDHLRQAAGQEERAAAAAPVAAARRKHR
jgi:tetratricopeptide (TPR) repeat protein